MGQIKLTGLGYDVEPSYEDKLEGLNAGYLSYSKIMINSSCSNKHEQSTECHEGFFKVKFIF